MKIYNKLIRDKIPDIIEKDHKKCETIFLGDDEYFLALKNKLQEELNEYLESDQIEELADLEEVLLAIVDYKNVSREDFEKIRNEKLIHKGGFRKRILLKKVID
jgi:predicted house-cleaning noncanonical NTP pyrophosphatase (MazG superfamily)